MLEDLEQIHRSAFAEAASIPDETALEDFRVRYLGKKGALTAAAARMKDLAPADRPLFGQKLNEVRTAISAAIEERGSQLLASRDAQAARGIDPTLPSRPLPQGSLHPLSQILDRAVDTLRRMGFALAEGPEIETEWHCFDALNTPPDHPARKESDTYYFPDGNLLRTHTSTVQIRTMETAGSLPLRIIAPGTAFRRDEIDETHSISFTQLEGLFVDRDVSLADLKGTLEAFFQVMFGSGTEVRFRPHFFPFTEPSFEIDVKLKSVGRAERWVEIAGCGLVDPAVFAAVCKSRGDDLFDPERVTGFAFGMGVDRLAMIQYGIPDLRLFNENDVRFLRQFA
jgi:phenylalanyl-tRNA synthetase alpha chain